MPRKYNIGHGPGKNMLQDNQRNLDQRRGRDAFNKDNLNTKKKSELKFKEPTEKEKAALKAYLEKSNRDYKNKMTITIVISLAIVAFLAWYLLG